PLLATLSLHDALPIFLRDARQQLRFRQAMRLEAVFGSDVRQVARVDHRSPVRMIGKRAVPPAEVNPVRVEGRADGASGVAGSGWNVHVAESGLAEDSRIGHAVQRDAAAEAE